MKAQIWNKNGWVNEIDPKNISKHFNKLKDVGTI